MDLDQLSRIDVQVVNSDESYGDPFMITDDETLGKLREAFHHIKWEPNVNPKMARKEDIKATLFFRYDKNMPERLIEYQIWFEQNLGTVTIISNNEKEGYGTLEKEYAENLENIFLNQ
ncbi:hypothetical protein ACSVDE_11485 [Pseudalkalibacillus sp. Hm43]|uniref:hypothetical protein n=1 Tax=Pseudalkalibacillus sp. Hm43 TaxID=3450742 RepID=UPI003F43126E